MQLGPTGSVIGGAIDEAVLEKICDLALGASTSMERIAASTMGPAGAEQRICQEQGSCRRRRLLRHFVAVDFVSDDACVIPQAVPQAVP
jgi:hypothetical protein